MKKIAVITSGGDAPGMNACVKSIVNMGYNLNYKTIAFQRGYDGLVKNDYVELTRASVADIFNMGGSKILTARSKEFMEEKYRKIAVQNLINSGAEALIVIGGNGSYAGATELMKMGVNVITIPATIDNDVYSTEMSIGFDSAVNNAVEMIDNIQETMRANQRICLVECMGRYGGNITLFSGLTSEADVIAVPEDKLDKSHIYRFIKGHLEYGNNSPFVVVAEKQFDIANLAKEIEKDFKHECRAVVLGYIQRGGRPTVKDRMLAIRFGVKAVEMIKNGQFNQSIGLKNDELITIPLTMAINTNSNFRFDLYEAFKLLHNPKLMKKSA